MTKLERASFPWASVIRFGVGRLRLPPGAFWALSLPELMAMLDNQTAHDTTTRQGIEALMAQFPDEPGNRSGLQAAGNPQSPTDGCRGPDQ